jgi:hypothetical protein
MIVSKEMKTAYQDFLEDFGFNLDPTILHYIKLFDGGKQVVFFHHISNSDSNCIEVQLGIRIDAVEDIINQFLPSLGDFSERSTTLIMPIDQINANMQRRYFIEDEKEVPEVLKKIESHLVKDGFRWLDRYSDPIVLEDYFNNNPDQEFITQNFTYRSARAITLCKLYNPDNYKDKKKAYLDKLEEMMVTPFTLASFLNLLNYLENN